MTEKREPAAPFRNLRLMTNGAESVYPASLSAEDRQHIESLGDLLVPVYELTPAEKAAPDLLEALEAMTRHYCQLVDSGDAGNWNSEAEPEVIKARAAIARAKGEQE